MARLKSDVAVAQANAVAQLVARIAALKADVSAIVAANGVNPLGNMWATLTTTAVNTDGGLAVVDGAPNAGHIIDPRSYPALSYGASPNDYNAGLQVLVDFATFCSGTQVPANAARPAQINNLSL